MSGTSLMTLGKQAVFAAYAQLQTTGNNIANANTPGYSRQSVQLATAGSAYNGSGYIGRGVTVSTVSRATNMFLSSQQVAATSAAAADGVRRDMLAQLEKVFVGGKAGLGGTATEVFNAFADVAAAPGDLSARTAVLGRLEDFASLARSSSDQIEALQTQTAHDVTGGVDEVNTLAEQLGRLNVNIAAAVRGGQRPNDLMDQRDQLVKRIGEQLQVSSYIGADETANVFVGSGQSLVLGAAAHSLVVQPDPQDPGRVSIAVNIAGYKTELSTQAIGDGLIGGLMQFQDRDLADARNRLGQLVAGFAGALNQQQGLGLDLAGAAGTPLFSYTGPQAVPASTNARGDDGSFATDVTLTTLDATALKASDYLLQPDPADGAAYLVTRLSDGKTFSGLASGAVVDGFRFEVSDPGLAPGESFTLKPVGRSAGDLSVVLKDPRGLAAANPVTAVVDPANAGNTAISAVNILALPANAYAPITIQFTDDTGGYQVLDVDGGVLDAGTRGAGEAIVYDGMSISISGLPRTDDRIQISPTVHPAASNGNAVRFDNLAGAMLIDGQTAADAYANTMADVGVRMQGASAAADTSAAVSAAATASLTGQVGVHLDEEAARLLQYQQSYQAAAKMLQTAQALFDAIMAAVR